MEISDYERWKFRRCIETLDRYGCSNSYEGSEGDECKKCKFNIINDMWDFLHCEMMRLEEPDHFFYNNESE